MFGFSKKKQLDVYDWSLVQQYIMPIASSDVYLRLVKEQANEAIRSEGSDHEFSSLVAENSVGQLFNYVIAEDLDGDKVRIDRNDHLVKWGADLQIVAEVSNKNLFERVIKGENIKIDEMSLANVTIHQVSAIKGGEYIASLMQYYYVYAMLDEIIGQKRGVDFCIATPARDMLFVMEYSEVNVEILAGHAMGLLKNHESSGIPFHRALTANIFRLSGKDGLTIAKEQNLDLSDLFGV